MGFTTVFPRPSRPIKGGSRNSGAAKGSPAPERDRHEEGARSLARWGFSRVLPGLKDVPGEAAAGAWGPAGRGRGGGISGIPQPAASGGQRGPGVLAAGVGRALRSGAGRLRSPGVAAGRGGGARLPPGPAPSPPPTPVTGAPPPPGRAAASPSAGAGAAGVRRGPPPVCSVVPFSSGLKY